VRPARARAALAQARAALAQARAALAQARAALAQARAALAQARAALAQARAALAKARPTARSDAALAQAKARLDPLDLYPRAVRIEHVRIVSAPWLFRLPWLRRFDGYATWGLVLLRSATLVDDGDLICHELCHVWQMQQRPLRMPLSYLRMGYATNPYELEARRAAATSSPRGS
jgi:multidrug efflux pump subunit AcrA (membrane-fusion protein)